MSDTRGKNIYRVEFENDLTIMAIAYDFGELFKHFRRLGYPGISEIHKVCEGVAIEIIPFEDDTES